MSELKPCPFCGGEVSMFSGWLLPPYIECSKCGIIMNGKTRSELRDKWNTRHERTCKYEQPDPRDHPGIWNTECGNHVYWNVDNEGCGLPPDYCPKCGAKVER